MENLCVTTLISDLRDEQQWIREKPSLGERPMDKQTGSFFKNAPLACPNCGDEYLHHHSIEVYHRDKEGSDSGLMTEISAGATTVTTNMDGNPSKRRDGIIINFSCETCDYKSKIVIVEKEGQAFFSME